MQTRLIVHALIVNDNKEVLLVKRSESDHVLPGFWDVPGGSLEAGEDPADGAIREAFEESGLRISKPSLFAFTSNVDVEKDTQFVRLIFWAKFPAGANIKLNPDEHSGYAVVNFDHAQKYKLVDYLPQIFLDLSREEFALK
jgi:8-oxo-dGTP diphosphatase